MQRILDPAQIEAFAERSIPRVRLPDPAVFGQRAERLRSLSSNHALREYLLLMAAVADAQQMQFDSLRSALGAEGFAEHIGKQLELAQAHRMPVLQAAGWPRQDRWRRILRDICGAVPAVPRFPPAVYALCERIIAAPDAELDAQADLLIAARADGVDGQAAPFIMAALQVYWAAMASTLRVTDVAQLDVPTVCPVCGSLPVASVVRSDKRGPQGYRYLHCGLCETEWHMVRITCSHCLTTEGITYNAIEGGSEAVRAETCRKCHTYRKILYQEKDTGVEPVADDLASLALDLLMTEEGFHRGSGNPLLWQTSET
ncbi:MAG TPA: formate dehydrogenase accessory protein FdhE [Steroidobacteraceae bacterium]|jgi:FdhE protein